jgi:hypothetical protein
MGRNPKTPRRLALAPVARCYRLSRLQRCASSILAPRSAVMPHAATGGGRNPDCAGSMVDPEKKARNRGRRGQATAPKRRGWLTAEVFSSARPARPATAPSSSRSCARGAHTPAPLRLIVRLLRIDELPTDLAVRFEVAGERRPSTARTSRTPSASFRYSSRSARHFIMFAPAVRNRCSAACVVVSTNVRAPERTRTRPARPSAANRHHRRAVSPTALTPQDEGQGNRNEEERDGR